MKDFFWFWSELQKFHGLFCVTTTRFYVTVNVVTKTRGEEAQGQANKHLAQASCPPA
jgi:hypothetical protein